MNNTLTSGTWRTPGIVLATGALILAIALGIRHAFGLFLPPMSATNGWGREVFALAIALQNLLWGVSQPFTGMIADRFGAGWAILGGGVLYVIGLVLMAGAHTQGELLFSAGVLIGFGLSGTTFAIVFGAISRAVPPERRSYALGAASAIGSFGQFIMLPGSLAFIEWLGWSVTLIALAVLAAIMIPASSALFEQRVVDRTGKGITLSGALSEAFHHRGFWLLSWGFFVCGFQVVFIATHLPAYLVDNGMSLQVGTTALALVGLFNIGGTYLAGVWGACYRKPALLAFIYLSRAVAIAALITFPLTEWSVYAFAIVMGLLWLSTVPLTNGTVATVFGVKNMSMLAGIVFFFHQVGAFFGVWLGGLIYDKTGNYDVVWAIAIGLSCVAALLNYPIAETPVPRLQNERVTA